MKTPFEQQLFDICAPTLDKLRASITDAEEAIHCMRHDFPNVQEATISIRDINRSDILSLKKGHLECKMIDGKEKYSCLINVTNKFKIKIYER